MLPDLCHHSFWKSSPKIGGPTGFDRCVYVNWPENRGKGPRTDERGAWFPFGCKKGLASCQILLISLDQSINFYLCWSAESHPEAFQSTLHDQSKNQQITPEQAWSDGKTPPVGTNCATPGEWSDLIWPVGLKRTYKIVEREGQRGGRAKVSGSGSTSKESMELNRSAANLSPES